MSEHLMLKPKRRFVKSCWWSLISSFQIITQYCKAKCNITILLA